MQPLKVITHSGRYHSDDIFAVATLSILFKQQNKSFEIIRTREPEIIKTGDFVVDVGGVYDSEHNAFDHHQPGGAGMRENKIPYAAFGLVWKKYGELVAGSPSRAAKIEKDLVMPIDANDNGVAISESLFNDVSPFLIQDFFRGFYPTWKESEDKLDTTFVELVTIAQGILLRKIKHEEAREEADQFVTAAYRLAPDKRLILLDKPYPWTDVLINFEEPLFVIKPVLDGTKWSVSAVPVDHSGSFKNRMALPQEWAGKRDEELQKITGVTDAVFCHNKLFMVVAVSKEGALQLAQLALAR